MKQLIIGENADKDQKIDKAMKVLVGIFDFVNFDENYIEGWRNDIAVDFCIACKVLDMNPNVAKGHLNLSTIDMMDLDERINTIIPYADSWYMTGNIWNYSLIPYEWEKLYDAHDPEHSVRIVKEYKDLIR